nr:hypothetical protein GCM10020093_094820 [Planobispora longispora]
MHAFDGGGADARVGGAGLAGGDLVAGLLARVHGAGGQEDGSAAERGLGLGLLVRLRLVLRLRLLLRLGLLLRPRLVLRLRLLLELGLLLGLDRGFRRGLGLGPLLRHGLGLRTAVLRAAEALDLGRGGRGAGGRVLGAVGEGRRGGQHGKAESAGGRQGLGETHDLPQWETAEGQHEPNSGTPSRVVILA